MADDMTKRERIRASLSGQPVDRVAIAMWRHWPVDDQDPVALAQRALEYQQRYDWDFIKIPPSHTYCVDDYGTKTVWRGRTIGDREHVDRVVKRIEDWDSIQPLDVNEGAYGKQLQCLRMVLDRREPEIPVIHTMFNPLNMARYLAGDETFLVHLRREPERVERALDALTATSVDFAKAVISGGADGVFLSTAAANHAAMSEAEYVRFGRPYDIRVLKAAAGGWFNVLHMCRHTPMLALVADYPIHAINWHDRAAGPDLAKAARVFPGTVVGGIEQHELLHFGTPADVDLQVQDAIRQMNGRRLIVAAGCTYQLTVPEGNLFAARRAVDGISARPQPSFG